MNARTQTHARTQPGAPNPKLRAARVAVDIARRNYARAQVLDDSRARGAAARRLAEAVAIALDLEAGGQL